MLSGWEVHHEMLHHIKQATELVHDHEIKEDKLHIYFVMVCNPIQTRLDQIRLDQIRLDQRPEQIRLIRLHNQMLFENLYFKKLYMLQYSANFMNLSMYAIFRSLSIMYVLMYTWYRRMKYVKYNQLMSECMTTMSTKVWV